MPRCSSVSNGLTEKICSALIFVHRCKCDTMFAGSVALDSLCEVSFFPSPKNVRRSAAAFAAICCLLPQLFYALSLREANTLVHCQLQPGRQSIRTNWGLTSTRSRLISIKRRGLVSRTLLHPCRLPTVTHIRVSSVSFVSHRLWEKISNLI